MPEDIAAHFRIETFVAVSSPVMGWKSEPKAKVRGIERRKGAYAG